MISPVQSLNNSTEIIPVIETDVVRNERLQISLTNASNGSSLYEVLSATSYHRPESWMLYYNEPCYCRS